MNLENNEITPKYPFKPDCRENLSGKLKGVSHQNDALQVLLDGALRVIWSASRWNVNITQNAG
jgi:hypothetical protein